MGPRRRAHGRLRTRTHRGAADARLAPRGLHADLVQLGVLAAKVLDGAPEREGASEFTGYSATSGEGRVVNLAGVEEPAGAVVADDRVPIAVVGAHMSGLPLNIQLTELGGRLEKAGRTAPVYRFYALPGGPPRRPGMVRPVCSSTINTSPSITTRSGSRRSRTVSRPPSCWR